MATRFELRSPHPKSNTYLVLASSYMAMLDGIDKALREEKTPSELESSLSKKYGEEDFYLEKDREYRSEKDVFEDYTDEERNTLFGVAPETVWENIQGFYDYPEKTEAISGGGVIPAPCHRVFRYLCDRSVEEGTPRQDNSRVYERYKRLQDDPRG